MDFYWSILLVCVYAWLTLQEVQDFAALANCFLLVLQEINTVSKLLHFYLNSCQWSACAVDLDFIIKIGIVIHRQLKVAGFML